MTSVTERIMKRVVEKSCRIYAAIDLKSFYASCECVERGLDPLNTNLVVADGSRTEKTICLAVSPSLKAHGISGRARLFEVVQQVKNVNAARERYAPDRRFTGASYVDSELKVHPELAIDYIAAPPRMALYMEYSTRIYEIYLRYISHEDIHVYSVDEVFLDITNYPETQRMGPEGFVRFLMRKVFEETGITATAGIGTNLYLCKIAMDVKAKKAQPDELGARMAVLDEESYKREMWEHRPITDLWRVGKGIARRLAEKGMYTMGDVARCSLGKPYEYRNEELLYKMFGVNAELLIDHAWGYEPCTIADIKAYRPGSNSLSIGQVLQRPYKHGETGIIVKEMADQLSLDLLYKGLVTNQIVLTIGYDIENLTDPEKAARYQGEITTDFYGRQVPKHAHGTENLQEYTCLTSVIMEGASALFKRIADPELLARRITIVANNVVPKDSAPKVEKDMQLSIFADIEQVEAQEGAQEESHRKEERIQETLLDIKKKFGKNAILRGMNFQEGATAKDRNRQIGGHKA